MNKSKIMCLCAILLALVLSACAGDTGAGGAAGGEAGGAGAAGAAAPAQDTAEVFDFMFVDEPLTLTAFIDFDQRAATTITSYNEQYAFIELANLTGITIDFIHPPAGQTDERFNLMVASGDLTDIIWRNWIAYPGGPVRAIADGVIIDIRHYKENYAPNKMDLILNHHYVDSRDLFTDYGQMFHFTFFRLDYLLRHTEGFYIRSDWLDTLGLNVPVSLCEWENVLRAMRDHGPFNDAPYVLPFFGQGIGAIHRFIPAHGIRRDFYMCPRDNVIKFGAVQPEYRDHVELMQRWFQEGLIDPEIMVTDGAGFFAKATSHLGGAFSGWLGGNMSTFLGLMQDDPDYALVGAGWPSLYPGGTRWNPSTIAHRAAEPSGFGISATNQHVRESVQFLDFLYSEEGHYLINFGPEGVAWDMVDGVPTFRDYIMNHPELSPIQAMTRYGQNTIWFSYIQDPHGFFQALRFPGTREAAEENSRSDKSLSLPWLTPTYEEGMRVATIMGDIWSFVNESYASWIVGGDSLDNWDDYVAELERLGINEVVAIQEAALARFNAR